MPEAHQSSPYIGLSPTVHFYRVIVPSVIIISVVLGFVTNVVFALQFAGVGASALGLVLWTQQDRRHHFMLSISSVIALAGWILFKYGIAGIPEALIRLGGMLLLCMIIVISLKLLNLPKVVIAKSTNFTDSDA